MTSYAATIDCARPSGALSHFWRSTGYTPAALTFDQALHETLDHLSGLPLTPAGQPGLRYVRIHFLLDLVTVKGMDTEAPVYDWSKLDAALDELVARRMCPFFELMGNPSGFFGDMRRAGMPEAWRRLVRDLAMHLGERYGREEVATWPFETWNEPDTPWWSWGGIDGLKRYTDACEAGLHDVDERIQFGGPGSAASLSEPLKELLAHCACGVNHFTGKKGTRLDFISVHEKGVVWSKEDVSPRLDLLCARTQQIIDWQRHHVPELNGVPWINNECDPQVGWSHPHPWHGRPFYAAWATRQIGWHLERFIDRCVDFRLLGNDHGFVGVWGQRSLLQCFGDDKDRAIGRFELVKKPILGAHLLWALLGGERLATPTGDSLGAIATRHADGAIAVLAWHSVDTPRRSGEGTVRLHLNRLPATGYRLVRLVLAEGQGDPMSVWEEQLYVPADATAASRLHGTNFDPEKSSVGPAALAAMRAVQEPHLAEEREVAPVGGALDLEFTLPLPSVSLLLLLPDPGVAPAQPHGLTARTQPGRTPEEHIVLRWHPQRDSHRLRTYRVEYRAHAGAAWELVNPDALGASFLHLRAPNAARGAYRVCAEDRWGRCSPWSAELTA
jgi:L-iduronidase